MISTVQRLFPTPFQLLGAAQLGWVFLALTLLEYWPRFARQIFASRLSCFAQRVMFGSFLLKNDGYIAKRYNFSGQKYVYPTLLNALVHCAEIQRGWVNQIPVTQLIAGPRSYVATSNCKFFENSSKKILKAVGALFILRQSLFPSRSQPHGNQKRKTM